MDPALLIWTFFLLLGIAGVCAIVAPWLSGVDE
jgi:hypothetical protein